MVGGTHVLPSVDTGGWNAVVRQLRRYAAVQTPVNCHCQLKKHRRRGRRASEVRHAVSDPGRGQTYCPWCTSKNSVAVISP